LFEITPVITGILAVASGLLAAFEFKNYGGRATEIKARSRAFGAQRND